MGKQRKQRKPRLIPPRVDPDEEWNKKHGADSDDGPDWKEASALCDTIGGKIDDAPDAIWANETACEFFESIQTKIASIQETINQNKRASEKQVSALKNMDAGVDKWLDR